MSMTDFVWIAIGETLLVATFALGILVGVSLTRKGIRHDNRNEGTTEGETGYDYWRDVERR
jgi:hypothetical protein